jgi:hypothetical protein
LLSIGVSVYVCVQFEKLKKAKQAAANRVRSRHPLVPESQTSDSLLETGAAAIEVDGPEPTISQLLFPDPVLEREPPGPDHEQHPSFPELVEPSDPTLSKTPPPTFEEAGKYPTLSLELDPPPPYPGLSTPELQQYPLNNPTYQLSNF